MTRSQAIAQAEATVQRAHRDARRTDPRSIAHVAAEIAEDLALAALWTARSASRQP
jgi:hypothetical protein